MEKISGLKQLSWVFPGCCFCPLCSAFSRVLDVTKQGHDSFVDVLCVLRRSGANGCIPHAENELRRDDVEIVGVLFLLPVGWTKRPWVTIIAGGSAFAAPLPPFWCVAGMLRGWVVRPHQTGMEHH